MYSEPEVVRAYPFREVDLGRRYLTQGRVLAAELSEDGRRVEGRVQGAERRANTVTVDITYHSSGPRSYASFREACNCVMGGQCSHAVAVLLQVLRKKEAPVQALAEIGDVDAPLENWLDTLALISRPPSSPNEYSDTIRFRALYVITLNNRKSSRPTAFVTPQSMTLDRGGRWGDQVGTVRASNLLNGTIPKYYRPIDKTLLSLLWAATVTAAGCVSFDDGRYPLVGDLSDQILHLILESGRGRWESIQGPQLVAGGPRPGRAFWETDAEGVQRFRLGGDIEGLLALPLPQPWYINPRSGEIGRLELDLPPHVLMALVAAPPIPPDLSTRLRRSLENVLPGRQHLLPREFGPQVVRDVVPVPCLRLFRRSATEVPWDDRNEAATLGRRETTLCGAVTFDYAGSRVRPDDRGVELAATITGTLVRVPRQPEIEEKALRHLITTGFRPIKGVANTFIHLANPQDPHWVGGSWTVMLAFLHRGVAGLRAAGWQVELDDAFDLEITEPAEDGWVAEVVEAGGRSGVDWFGLSLGVTVGGERIDLLPVLLPVLREMPEDGALEGFDQFADAGGTLFAPIDAKRMLPLPAARLKPLLFALYELYRVGSILDDGTVKLTLSRAAELADVAAAAEAAGMRWFGGERLLDVGRKLRDFSGLDPVPVPASFQGTLRAYQRDGVTWLQFLRDFDFGGILADDMGLGKTIQTLTHLLIEQEAGRLDRPALVVAPTTLVTNWRLEAARFAPTLRVLVLHGANRKAEFERMADHDLVLTTYPLLFRDKEILCACPWSLLILDEAQTIKNPKAQASLVVQQLSARHRLCLTGTPMENNLGELWALFHFLMPGLLGNQRQFQRSFRTPIEKQGDRRRQRDLTRRIRPFMLRRTKQQVAAELPEKTEINEYIELEGPQRDFYESIRLALDAKVQAEITAKGLARSHIVILDALLKLRQICCDARLVKLVAAKGVKRSAKLERLMEMLPELIEEGRRILLFSQFTAMLDLIQSELDNAKIGYVKLTGQTRDRQTPIDLFQAGTVPVFLISLKAGGTGLNLTAADTVIHYDPWWNPAVERQATDRAHRIGQDKPVFVYKLVTVGTVETAILDLQARKQALADGLYDPEAVEDITLTKDDLTALFAPLA